MPVKITGIINLKRNTIICSSFYDDFFLIFSYAYALQFYDVFFSCHKA